MITLDELIQELQQIRKTTKEDGPVGKGRLPVHRAGSPLV